MQRRAVLCACFAAPLLACDDPHAPPPIDRTALAAAQREIAAAPPLQPVPRSREEQQVMLRRVAPRLLAAAQPLCRQERGADCAFRIGIVEAPEANAFASGRDQVGVTTGMLRMVANDDELAAVLAHEFAHHIANHIQESGWRTQAGAVAGSLLGGVASNVIGYDLGLSRLGAEAGAYAARLSFSKAEEREADYLGAWIMARAGFDLDRAGGLWAKLTRGGGSSETRFLDSHPAGPERLALWRATAAQIRESREALPPKRG